MPFPSTTVFHPSWAAHVRPTNEDSFNVLLTITLPGGGGGWDPDTGPTPDTPTKVYTGAARVTYQPTQAAEGDAVGQEVSSSRVQVTIPRDAITVVPNQLSGARIHVDSVTDPNAPTTLVGRVLFVETGSWSSHTWELLLDATDDQSNQEVTP